MPGAAAGEPDSVELLDLGDGRQLARFGRYVVDRPYPAALEARGDPAAWASADLRFERGAAADGHWTGRAVVPTSWQVTFGGACFELRPTPSGQVGLFLEQADVWPWIRQVLQAAPPDRRQTVLNLFAYTGGSTLAAATAGASVTHVDAARSSVAWARRNAELSGLGSAPIRWIIDDALGFTRREARRGRRYDGLILDPPSYGHGPDGERWTLADRLPELMDACLAVLEPAAGFVLLTAHAERLRPEDLAGALADAFERAGRHVAVHDIASSTLELTAASGRTAPAGLAVRWPA